MADKKAITAKRLKEREQAAKKRFKLPEGETTFRVLPNKNGEKELEYYEYAMHSNVGPRRGYVRCGKNFKGKGECWLCDEMLPKLASSGKGSKKKAAEEMARRENFAVQIATKNEDGDWGGPFIWEMPMSVANKLMGMMAKRDISDPKKGYNITISRTGTGRMDTRYGDMDRDDEKSEAPEEILERLKDFKSLIKEYDEDAMKAAFYGHEQDEDEAEETTKKGDDDDGEDEEEKPKSSKKPKDEDDEDEVTESDSEDDDEDESEDEDEKPKKKSKKKPADDDEEEDSEDDDSDVAEALDEEDEEDEKPKKKKKPVEEEEDETEDEDSEGADEDEEEKPKKKGKKVVEDEEDEEEETPKKKSKKKAKDEDEDDED